MPAIGRNLARLMLGMAVGSGGWAFASAGAALAQSAEVASTAPPAPAAPLPAAGEDQLSTSRRELTDLEATLSASDAERHRIAADIEQIRTDRVRLNAALIETTGKVQEAEAKVAAIQTKLEDLRASEAAVKTSLEARRGTIAEVLATLQRMGRKPPPALLVNPDDILATIRTSMLLGAVVPEMRAQVETLVSDLSDLQHLRRSIDKQREDLTAEVTGLSSEQHRLDALVEARQAAQAAAETALGNEQGHAADVARQASSLKDLIARMENDVASAKRAGDAARAADADRRRLAQSDADGVRARAVGSFRDPARLAPAIDFPDSRAMLSLPAAGRLVKRFGSADEFGGTEKGLSIATLPQAIVSTPSDGWVAFSGPYRTYGQILIINAGSGYYIVLAGMKSVSVAPGQFVLAGEPVAMMGDGSVKTAAAISLGSVDPILYVEFRKDGAAVDPTPWWSKAELEKVRG